MTNARPAYVEAPPSEAGQHFARLEQMLALVEQVAGHEPPRLFDYDRERVRVGRAYEYASPIAQRRFDTLVEETSIWASFGVDVLAASDDPHHPHTHAAARLADELEQALEEIGRSLNLQPPLP